MVLEKNGAHTCSEQTCVALMSSEPFAEVEHVQWTAQTIIYVSVGVLKKELGVGALICILKCRVKKQSHGSQSEWVLELQPLCKW